MDYQQADAESVSDIYQPCETVVITVAFPRFDLAESVDNYHSGVWMILKKIFQFFGSAMVQIRPVCGPEQTFGNRLTIEQLVRASLQAAVGVLKSQVENITL